MEESYIGLAKRYQGSEHVTVAKFQADTDGESAGFEDFSYNSYAA